MLMSLSRRIDARCSSGAWTAKTLKKSRMSSGGPWPQKLMPIRPPGRSTRYASSSAASQPPQMPLTDTAASNDASAHGSSYIEPTRRSAVGVRSRATAISSVDGVDAGDGRARRVREAHGQARTARDVEQRRVLARCRARE